MCKCHITYPKHSGSPFCNLKSCLRHALVIPGNMVTVDGSECDKPGVSLQQWGRDGFCKYTAGNCFAKNLKWFYEYNVQATNSGADPVYAVRNRATLRWTLCKS